MKKEMRSVGVSYPRHDALEKAMGTALYTDDIFMPGMVYGMILRSPHANARVKSLDVSKASELDGVLGILTPQDVTQRLYNCSGNPPSALIVPDEKILTMHPKCLGDRVCAVVAVSPDICEKALCLISVEYEVLPALMSIEDALKPDAKLVQPDISESNIMKTLVFPQGDIEKGFAEADYVFEETFYAQPIQHVAMEPTGCICDYKINGKVTIFSPSQTPYQERRILAELLDMNESDIRIIKPAMGSGFGARQQLHNQHVALLLSKLVKRPVKLMNTREEDMYASVTRHETKCTIKLGVMKDGTITTAHIKNYLNGGPYITHTPTVSAAAGRKFQYRAPNYLYEGISVYTNSPTAGAMRGYGNIQVVAGREVLIERIAYELGLDPIKMRLQNHVGVGDQFPAAGYDILSCGILECVNKAEEIKKAIETLEPQINNSEISEAWGYAFCCHSSGPSNKDGMSSAVVMANDDGSVTLSIGSADIGQGSQTIMGQIAAEELAVDYSAVYVSAADTANNPYDTGTFASGQTYVCGNAVSLACADMRKKIISALGILFEINSEEIKYEDGCYHFTSSCGEQKKLTFRSAVSALAFGMTGQVLIGSATYKALASPPPFAVCYAKASYNKKYNTVTLKDVIEVADVGTAINPESVKGQIEGGVGMGVGYALMENMEYDRYAKKTPSSDLLHYKVPLTVDMPRIHAAIAENSYEPTGPLGAKSVGELAQVPVAPAIINAVIKATGTPIVRMPLTQVYMPDGLRRDIVFGKGEISS